MISSCVSCWFRVQMKTADLKCPHAEDLKDESYHQLGRKKNGRENCTVDLTRNLDSSQTFRLCISKF